MKEKIEHMLSRSRSSMFLAVYSLVLVLMGYKLLTSTTVLELVLFAIPTACCLYAIFGTKRENNFALVNEMVQTQCKPEEALKVMEDDPSMLKKQRQQNVLHLLKAYALIDSSRFDEAITYVTVTEKGAFSTEAAAPVAAYLLFTAAFLSRDTELGRQYHEALLEKQDAFTVDGTPTFLWYILAANYQTASGHFEKAEKMMEKVDECQLKTNRDRAYFAYYRYRILAGRARWEEAWDQLARARELAPGIRVFTEET